MNLDDYDPGYSGVPSRLKMGEKKRYHYVHTSSYSQHRRPTIGIHPTKMIDWRSLESRRHELWVAYKTANKRFWDFMDSVGRRCTPDEEKWVMFDDQLVCRFYERGYTMSDASLLLDDLLSNKKYYDPYFLVKPEEGGSKARQLKHSMDRLLWAHTIYDLAFKRAVENRLNKYTDETSGGKSIGAQIFLVKNEGRTTVVMLDHCGRITFPEGKVEECV